MFSKLSKYLAPYFTVEDLRIQFGGPLAQYAYDYRMAQVTHHT